MFKFKEYDFKRYKFSILFIIIILVCIGSYLMQYLQKASEKHFEKQLIGLAIGLVITFIVSLIDYHFICKFFIPMYLFNLFLLAMVKYSKFGAKQYDAKRWLRFPNGSVTSAEATLQIQPTELSKIIFILFIAKFFDLMYKSINKWYVIIISCILVMIPVYFIFDQPDLSTSIVMITTFLIMLFIAGLSYKILSIGVLIGIPAVLGLYWYIQQPFQKLLQPYQINRILAIQDPEQYTENLMWQQDNAAKAIKSGGIIGRIFTEDIIQLDSGHIAAAESDFIFAAIAEGFGFIGSCLIILLFAYMVFKFLMIAKNAKDRLGTYIAVGIAVLIMIQFFINIGVVTSLLPNTGIPLPFVSSGLSALLINMLMIGIILNVDMQHKIST